MYSLHPAPQRFIQGKQRGKYKDVILWKDVGIDFVPNRLGNYSAARFVNGKKWCAALPKSWSLQFLIFPLSGWALEFILHVFCT